MLLWRQDLELFKVRTYQVMFCSLIHATFGSKYCFPLLDVLKRLQTLIPHLSDLIQAWRERLTGHFSAIWTCWNVDLQASVLRKQHCSMAADISKFVHRVLDGEAIFLRLNQNLECIGRAATTGLCGRYVRYKRFQFFWSWDASPLQKQSTFQRLESIGPKKLNFISTPELQRHLGPFLQCISVIWKLRCSFVLRWFHTGQS